MSDNGSRGQSVIGHKTAEPAPPVTHSYADELARIQRERREAEERRYPFLLVYGLTLAAVLIGVFFGGLLASAPYAYAAEDYTGDTFTYDGQEYPSTLAGHTVTLNAAPSSPQPYFGTSQISNNLNAGTLNWAGNVWYGIPVHSAYFPDINGGLAWYAETDGTSNQWFLAICGVADIQAAKENGMYYQGNAGWGGKYNTAPSLRTISFTAWASGMSHLADSRNFIRYIVDNSDWRTRYTIVHPDEPPAADAPVIEQLRVEAIPGVQIGQRQVSVLFADPQPVSVTISDGTTTVNLIHAAPPNPTITKTWWTVTIPNSGDWTLTATSSTGATLEQSLGYVESENTPVEDYFETAGGFIRTIADVIGNFGAILFGWMPTELRALTITVFSIIIVFGFIKLVI